MVLKVLSLISWHGLSFGACHTFLPNLPSSKNFLPVLKKFPIALANIIHTCPVIFYAKFSFTKNVMGCSPKLSLCKPKVVAHETLNQWEFKDSQEPWPIFFCVNKPLSLVWDQWIFVWSALFLYRWRNSILFKYKIK